MKEANLVIPVKMSPAPVQQLSVLEIIQEDQENLKAYLKEKGEGDCQNSSKKRGMIYEQRSIPHS